MEAPPPPSAVAEKPPPPQQEDEQQQQQQQQQQQHQQQEAGHPLAPSPSPAAAAAAVAPPPPAAASNDNDDDDAPPLSPEDIEAYVRDGFVLLKRAFPPSAAAACREELWRLLAENQGIRRNDPRTWPVKCPLAFIFEEGHGQPWADVFTPRLARAVDQLCGPGRWEPFGCGWWMMTFPGHHDPDQWRLDGHWHVDGTSRRRCLHTREVGVVPIFLFSDVQPRYGGTALCRGSHHFIARLLAQAGPGGLDAVELIQQAKAHANAIMEADPGAIVETVGEAGDVMFTHPFLVHGRSTNCAPVESGERGVRFMCHPGVRLREFPTFAAAAGEGALTPLEAGVLRGLQGAEDKKEEEGRAICTHEECLRQLEAEAAEAEAGAHQGKDAAVGGKRKGSRASGQEGKGALSPPEGVDEELWATMGMAGFGKRRRQ